MRHSKFTNADLHVTPAAAAVLALEVSLVKGIVSACMTGNINGFAETLDVGADIAQQAVRNPTQYRIPKP